MSARLEVRRRGRKRGRGDPGRSVDCATTALRADLAALEARLIRWIIGSALVGGALTVATVGLLFRLLG